MKYDIVGIGELLIDFVPVGYRTYQGNPGGGPPNMLAGATKLGCKTAFLGMVGDDGFGKQLEGDLIELGIDTAGLRKTSEASTTLAFVHLDSEGDRSFSFIRKPGADMLYSKDDIDYTIIDNSKIFHFSSVSMSKEPARETNLIAAKYAKETGKIVSYDPNLRKVLWDNLDEAKEVIFEGLKYADILKISEEELLFLTGQNDLEKGSQMLLDSDVKILFITLGAEGCFYATKKYSGYLPTYDVKVVDTTGAGDAFTSGILVSILKQGGELGDYSKTELEKMVNFANAVGALSTTKKGGVTSMPTQAEVISCISHNLKNTN